MPRERYRVNVDREEGVVDLLFEGASVTFEQVRAALDEIRAHFARGYKVKIRGYLARKSEALEAFMYAVEFLGQGDRIVFEERARYSRAERRAKRTRALELRRQGRGAREISEEVGVPLKTVYRWLRELRY